MGWANRLNRPFSLIALKHKAPHDTPGMGYRLLGIVGLVGLCGFSIPPLGSMSAFGAMGLWNHPIKKYARIAKFGWLGLIGLAVYLITLSNPGLIA